MQAEVFRRRVSELRQLMQIESVSAVFITPSADMHYLTGLRAVTSERPLLLVIQPDRRPLLVVPQLEAAGMRVGDDIEIQSYAETENPFQFLSGVERSHPLQSVFAVSDHMPASVLLTIQNKFPQARYERASSLMRHLRVVKDAEEFDAMQRAGEMADAAFLELLSRRFSDKTEREVAEELRLLLSAQGLEQAGWGPIVAAGRNAASPHHGTGVHVITAGEGVLLDFGGTVDGYQADITRSIHVGTPSDEFRTVHGVVLSAQKRGVERSTVGTPAQEVDRATRSVVVQAGYQSYFIHRTGHGVGLDVHEDPYIVEGNTDVLRENMAFSVEPGVYVPGRLGVRIEDVVVVQRDGPVRLTQATRELVVVR